MHIPNDDTQNYLVCRLKLVVETLDTQLIEPTNKNTINVPKVFKPTKRETIKLWGLLYFSYFQGVTL